MSSATVTYHDLPPEPWSGGPSSCAEIPNKTSEQTESFPTINTEELRDVKWPAQQTSITPLRENYRQTNTTGKVRNRLSLSNHSEELCLVCGDKASGYHYNALTCEGCKGFFRRSITRKAVYYCKFTQSCDIDMYMRRKCQHCRLEKCSKVGMRADLVIPEEQCRLKREAKLKHKSERESNKDTDGALFPSQTTKEVQIPEETSELIGRVASLQGQFSQPPDEAMRVLTVSTSKFQLLAELTILEAQLTHEFVRALPGFHKLSENDKKVIQKESKSELLLLRLSQKFDQPTNSIVFGNDFYQHRFTQLEYGAASNIQIARNTFEFVKSLLKMSPDTNEISLLMAIATFTDRPGIHNSKEVEEIQEVYTTALKQYVEMHRPKQRQIFAKLLVKIADLRTVSGYRRLRYPIQEMSNPLNYQAKVLCHPIKTEPAFYYNPYSA